MPKKIKKRDKSIKRKALSQKLEVWDLLARSFRPDDPRRKFAEAEKEKIELKLQKLRNGTIKQRLAGWGNWTQ